jgi:hypothetical protein
VVPAVQLRRIEDPGRRTQAHLDVAVRSMPMKPVSALNHMTTVGGAPSTK